MKAFLVNAIDLVKRSATDRLIQFLIAMAILTAMVVVANSDISQLKDDNGGSYYIRMITNQSLTSIPAPFCYRILAPGMCLGSKAAGFFIMWFGYWFFLWGLYVLMSEFNMSVETRWYSGLLFILWFEVGNNIQWFILPDPVMLMLVVWGAIFALRQNHFVAGVLAVFAVLAREIGLTLSILGLTLTLRQKPSRRLSLAFYAAPAVILSTVYLAITPGPVPEGSPSYTASIPKMLSATLHHFQGKWLTWDWSFSFIYLLIPLIACGVLFIAEMVKGRGELDEASRDGFDNMLITLSILSLPILTTPFIIDTPRIAIFSAIPVFILAGLGLRWLVGAIRPVIRVAILASYFIFYTINVRDVSMLFVFITVILLGRLESRFNALTDLLGRK